MLNSNRKRGILNSLATRRLHDEFKRIFNDCMTGERDCWRRDVKKAEKREQAALKEETKIAFGWNGTQATVHKVRVGRL